MAKNDSKQTVERQMVWEGLNGVIFVPHYTKPNLFVGPGTQRASETPRTYTALELANAGARMRSEMLWPRPRG